MSKQTQSKSQHARFLETARALSADEDPAAFRAALGQVGRHKPKGEVPEPPEVPEVPEKAPRRAR